MAIYYLAQPSSRRGGNGSSLRQRCSIETNCYAVPRTLSSMPRQWQSLKLRQLRTVPGDELVGLTSFHAIGPIRVGDDGPAHSHQIDFFGRDHLGQCGDIVGRRGASVPISS